MSALPSVKDRFIELRGQGLTYDLIAQELNVTKRSLIRWGKILKSQIDPLRAAHRESLLDQYCALKERRIELFGKKLQTLLQTLDQRDMHGITTPKLFELVLKYAAVLKKEDDDLTGALEKETESPDQNDPELESEDFLPRPGPEKEKMGSETL
jgi:hypothetical protein